MLYITACTTIILLVLFIAILVSSIATRLFKAFRPPKGVKSKIATIKTIIVIVTLCLLILAYLLITFLSYLIVILPLFLLQESLYRISPIKIIGTTTIQFISILLTAIMGRGRIEERVLRGKASVMAMIAISFTFLYTLVSFSFLYPTGGRITYMAILYLFLLAPIIITITLTLEPETLIISSSTKKALIHAGVHMTPFAVLIIITRTSYYDLCISFLIPLIMLSLCYSTAAIIVYEIYKIQIASQSNTS
ncbi:MAG: hypothetical protein DRO40_10345 [Thermoprotei archaeon]|nr:MAG: hypothetical protein DRO40_10345 [Thermoprotei archaeon]